MTGTTGQRGSDTKRTEKGDMPQDEQKMPEGEEASETEAERAGNKPGQGSKPGQGAKK